MKELQQLRNTVKEQQKRIQKLEEDVFSGFLRGAGKGLGKDISEIDLNSNANDLLEERSLSPQKSKINKEKPAATAKNEVVPAAKAQQLVQLLLEDHNVTLALMDRTPASDSDAAASSLVCIFEDRKQIMSLLKSTIEREVEIATSVKSIFRLNNLHSKLLSYHAKMVGHNFLRQSLGVYVSMMIADSALLEVDPNRFTNPEKSVLEANQKNLIDLIKQFVDCIRVSHEIAPPSFREISRILKTKVTEKFPEANALIAVGSFIFLRLFCPAVVDPQSYGLVNVRNFLFL
jgi:hypothetical protein